MASKLYTVKKKNLDDGTGKRKQIKINKVESKDAVGAVKQMRQKAGKSYGSAKEAIDAKLKNPKAVGVKATKIRDKYGNMVTIGQAKMNNKKYDRENKTMRGDYNPLTGKASDGKGLSGLKPGEKKPKPKPAGQTTSKGGKFDGKTYNTRKELVAAIRAKNSGNPNWKEPAWMKKK